MNKIIKDHCAFCTANYKEDIMADSIFKDKTLLITGGTGSFGHTVLKHFLSTDIGEIRIFSRDEKRRAAGWIPAAPKTPCTRAQCAR